MRFETLFIIAAILIMAAAGFGQTELTIKKKMTMKIPGMPDMSAMPNGMSNPLKDRVSTVYIKGGRMRTDMRTEEPKKMGGKQTVNYSTVVQCDKKQTLSFNSKKKKYHLEGLNGPTSATTANSKKGGYITVTGGVTDTGERAKLFGFDARHLKETYTMTPSPNACQKDKLKIEIEGWYADVPEFSCPAQRKPREFQMGSNCFDDVDFRVSGGGITGIALKEVKKITVDGNTIIMEEEATSVSRSPVADSIFEPPMGYRAANTLKEVEDDSPDDTADSTAAASVPQPENQPANAAATTFAVPKAGIERPVAGEKQPGVIRIGVLKPKVTTPDSKNDPEAGAELSSAVSVSLVESLKAPNVEAVEVNDPADALAKKCDYTLYSNVMQKRGGGGMFGKMIAVGAISVAGAFIPGIGGMVASTVASQVMSQTMMKSAKAKDEFSFDYKVVSAQNATLAAAVSKKKTEKDGEDVLTPQVLDASKAIIAKLPKVVSNL